ncbi:ACT domain-containing protein [Limosilactobacillus fermentum]|uniref:ACT domain-containing protein n=1 Tax=Limosilactobacillus fermentum TaxID=1613 RepID=UPI002D78053C|nr:ACT domain-containing protein [Limosilactobacillus fermentum]WRQ24774.1 ACT domain-containing protein [Limosilactobacillus fermentum]
MKAIVTTVGQDQVGIIAGVSHYLSTAQINILDVSQTIMSGYFTMMMMVEVPADQEFTKLAADLKDLGTQLGVEINIRNERLYQAMHQL